MPNFNELAAFAAVVREGSFTRAAAQLGVTPSALSHGVRQLERRLGLTLLHRSTRSIAPTEAGQSLYQTVAPRLADITQELEALITQGDDIAGTVRINAPDYAVQALIWPRLSPLLKEHPRLHVEVHSEDRFTDIVANRFDIGVRLGHDVAQDMIAARIAPDMVMAVAASPEFLALHGTPRTPQALDAHHCIGLRLPTHDNVMAWEFKAKAGNSEKGGKSIHVRPAGRLVCNQPAVMINAACEGHGFIWLPRSMIEGEVAQGRLATVLDDWAAIYEGYHLYYTARRASPAMKMVIEALRLRDAGNASLT